DQLVQDGLISSTREAHREIKISRDSNLLTWADANKSIFTVPIAGEALIVADIFKVAHFQQNIENQKILNGGLNADPFVVAKAAFEHKTVVTMELFKPNGTKIPNICEHLKVKCLTLQEFMLEQGWRF
ncbi:MAG: DUF4411 family protein, partial [Candidatus Obscuribacterales bacterium]